MEWMKFVKEYQSLIGAFSALVFLWRFMYIPMVKLIDINTYRINALENFNYKK